ncbi:hypothetical protein PLICRDRAFT_136749 [Plicaturopsis crispa FD-325 SS-3]|nr:hypothetical protein PLICRDRAFT_136749 [Plicaturopsis crispa FD-325 SS-3]
MMNVHSDWCIMLFPVTRAVPTATFGCSPSTAHTEQGFPLHWRRSSLYAARGVESRHASWQQAYARSHSRYRLHPLQVLLRRTSSPTYSRLRRHAGHPLESHSHSPTRATCPPSDPAPSPSSIQAVAKPSPRVCSSQRVSRAACSAPSFVS